MSGEKVSPRVTRRWFELFVADVSSDIGEIEIDQIVLLAYSPTGGTDDDNRYLPMAEVMNRDGSNPRKLVRTMAPPGLANGQEIRFEVNQVHPDPVGSGDLPATHIGLRGQAQGSETPDDRYLWIGRLKTPSGEDAEVELQPGDFHILPVGSLLARVS